MIVCIKDDFSLKKIADSGQCFRVREFNKCPDMSQVAPAEGTFRFVFRSNVLYIREISTGNYEASCSEEEWKKIWFSYFNLDTNYADIRKSISDSDIYLKRAADCACGVRILRQDPWEMLITFIISQRKSIPAIKGNVEQIASLFGTEVHTEYEDLYLFPTPEQIFCRDLEKPDLLSGCKLGYRLPYVRDAIEKVCNNKLDLVRIAALSDSELLDTLKTVKGVGDKVANCISLFGYHRTGNAPVDVWIHRAIDEHYGGVNPFPEYGKNAGIMQQFLFYYAIAGKKK